MKIQVVCSDPGHPVWPYLQDWRERQSEKHELAIVERADQLDGGDLLFLVSCSEIVGSAYRELYEHCLVLHASDLPRGRGWSPHIWGIIGGANQLTVTLLEAADPVDSGRIVKKLSVPVPNHALWDEINTALFEAELSLMDFAVENFGHLEFYAQEQEGASWFEKRQPADSEIDPEQSIAEQFDRIRVCDPERYPAFIRHRGHRYKLTLEKLVDDQPDD